MSTGFAASKRGLQMALACELTGSWPSEAVEHSQLDRVIAAALQARLYRERAKRHKK